jgi:EGF-like domain
MKCCKVLLLITVSCFLGLSSNTAADTNVRRRVNSSPCERNICHENATCIPFMELEDYICQCNEGFSGDGVGNCVLTDAPTLSPQLPPATQPTIDEHPSPPSAPSVPDGSVTPHPVDIVAPPIDPAIISPSFPQPVAPAMSPAVTLGPIHTFGPSGWPVDTEPPVGHLQSKTIIKASHVFKGPIL